MIFSFCVQLATPLNAYKIPDFNSFQPRSWVEKMARYSSQVKDDAGSGTTAESERVQRWKKDLTKEILEECYPIIGNLLQELGYE